MAWLASLFSSMAAVAGRSAPPRTCAVIGGGIAGLACAQRLEAHGVRATVFDTGRKAPGGRASSRELLLPNGQLAFDHAAQFFTATGAFAEAVRGWEAEGGVVRRWDRGLGEIDARTGAFTEYADGVERWMGARSMGDLSARLARGLDVRQNMWVSPDGGVTRDADGTWLIRSGGRQIGKYDLVALAHNGKCAERLSKGAGSQAVHRLLRARFAPALDPAANDRLVLNSLYSLFVVLPAGQLTLPPTLSGARVLHSADLSFAVCHARKRPECARALGPDEEAWTVISSAAFGAKHKAPQEALPKHVAQEVTDRLLTALAAVARAPKPLQPKRTHLQLWGAAVPLNVWRADGLVSSSLPPCAVDSALRIGACGDWLREPSIQGAWESGVALADALSQGGACSDTVPFRAAAWLPVAALAANVGAAGFFVDPQDEQRPAKSAGTMAPPPRRTRAAAPAGGRGSAPSPLSRAFVSNLPPTADEAGLAACVRAACSAGAAGSVLRVSIPRRPDGGTRGFGFVDLASDAALSLLLDAPLIELGGRRLRIERAKDEPLRARPGPASQVRQPQTATQ